MKIHATKWVKISVPRLAFYQQFGNGYSRDFQTEASLARRRDLPDW